MKVFNGFWPLLAIFSLWLVVVVANFYLGTWLSGWDNLHAEFDVGLNLQRSVFSVWQEYQGLGLLAGMAHAADLPRVLFVGLLSFILPAESVRYGFHFLMLLIGPLGMFFLLNKFVLKNEKASLIGAIFYLLDLATLQVFYLPFEPFSVHFAFLPWLFLVDLNFLTQANRRNLIWLVVVNFLAVPQAYVQTLFLVYVVGVGLTSLWMIFSRMTSWKRAMVLFGLIFVVNAFWLLPNLFFTVTNVSVTMEAKMNQMATEVNILKNQEFGDLGNLSLLKGFWFDAREFDRHGDNVFVLGSWVSYFNSVWVKVVGYVVFLTALFGIFGIWRGRLDRAKVFIPVFLFAVFGLMLPILSNLPLLSQIFRTSFTKLSILLVFCLAIFYACAFVFLQRKVSRKIANVAFVLFIFLPIVLMAPVFFGDLFYQKERAAIPKEYFETIQFFKGQDPNTRIANFPQVSYWGWNLYAWNYSGSGFLWYGTAQPILDRAFDVWSRENENYYWEVSQALYAKDLSLFENVLEKYRVNWLLIDENVVNYSSPKALFVDELKEMIGRSDKFKQVGQFGKIGVFEVRQDRVTKDFVSIVTALPKIGPGYKWGNRDVAFEIYGDYEEGAEILFKNRTLFSGKRQEDLEFDPAVLPRKLIQEFKVARRCEDALGKTEECVTIHLPDLSHNQGYLISAESNNIAGLPVMFWVENTNSRRSDLETYLPKGAVTSQFVLPPMAADGRGYVMHFDNVSVGKEKAVNEVFKVTVAKIDYEKLISERTGNSELTVSYLPERNFEVRHPNPAWYQVNLKQSPTGGNIILVQAFENGWVAWDQDFRFLPHKKINNWANGWELSGNEKIIYIFFWPQVLEFVGFGILILTLSYLVVTFLASTRKVTKE